MFEVERIEDWQGCDVVDTDGEKIGTLEEVFTDRDSGEPSLGSVKTGLFGRHLNLVPLAGATLTPESMRVPFTKEQVEGAPQAEGGGELDGERERDIFNYFGIAQPAQTGDEASSVRYESTRAVADRQSEAEELRAKAHELDVDAENHGSRATEAEEQAKRAREAHQEAAERQSEQRAEAEKLRERADELEAR